jgi:hypothetical protein
MIGVLASVGVLACLLCCGYVSARLALGRLDSGQPPKLGASYRVYVLIPRVYGSIVGRKSSGFAAAPAADSAFRGGTFSGSEGVDHAA